MVADAEVKEWELEGSKGGGKKGGVGSGVDELMGSKTS